MVSQVPLDYWDTYGYDKCPPTLTGHKLPTYMPSAFTIQNIFKDRTNRKRYDLL